MTETDTRAHVLSADTGPHRSVSFREVAPVDGPLVAQDGVDKGDRHAFAGDAP